MSEDDLLLAADGAVVETAAVIDDPAHPLAGYRVDDDDDDDPVLLNAGGITGERGGQQRQRGPADAAMNDGEDLTSTAAAVEGAGWQHAFSLRHQTNHAARRIAAATAATTPARQWPAASRTGTAAAGRRCHRVDPTTPSRD